MRHDGPDNRQTLSASSGVNHQAGILSNRSLFDSMTIIVVREEGRRGEIPIGPLRGAPPEF